MDGEGSIVLVNRGKNSLTLRLTITSTYRPLLERVLRVVCVGAITSLSRFARSEHHADAHYWQCYSANARGLLKQMLPWLEVKKEKAMKAIAGETWEKDRRWLHCKKPSGRPKRDDTVTEKRRP
ncbi:MAG TPA: hypothetical protein VEU08_14575 [Vicinamibacterales bacterium]|nr:hypothetical protein [Vicinamibacterales bacterium]